MILMNPGFKYIIWMVMSGLETQLIHGIKSIIPLPLPPTIFQFMRWVTMTEKQHSTFTGLRTLLILMRVQLQLSNYQNLGKLL